MTTELLEIMNNFTLECLGIGNQSISCSLTIFPLTLIDSRGVKIIYLNLDILGL